MRAHQSLVSRLDNVFKPLEPLFEENSSPSQSTGRYAQKRREEQFTRPLPSVSKYLESASLGSPRTTSEFRALVKKKRLAIRFLDQLKPRSKFVAAALEESELPLASLPEVAVIGRSNSGKSTLINAIVGTRCCEVQDKPGSTRRLNFYKIGDPPLVTFVDIPGFGFAYAKNSERSQWTEFALWYLKTRRNLRLVILVADARHGLSDSDSELIPFLRSNKIEFRVALNKCDLVHRGELAKRLTVLGKDLNVSDSQLLEKILPVSALRDQGIERLRKTVESFKMKREIVIAGERKMVLDLLEQRRLKKAQQRADRTARREEQFNDLFRHSEHERESKTKSDELEENSIDSNAYQPDQTSILKRQSAADGKDIQVLEFEDFVSQDEIENLGKKRGKAASPEIGADNTEYEKSMKLNHQLDWKMKLDLQQGPREEKFERPAKAEDDLSALGFITTVDTAEIPKGIRKWKIPGLKPKGKVSRAKPKPDLVSRIKIDRKHS